MSGEVPLLPIGGFDSRPSGLALLEIDFAWSCFILARRALNRLVSNFWMDFSFVQQKGTEESYHSLFRGLSFKMFDMLPSLLHSLPWSQQSLVCLSLCCFCEEDLLAGNLDWWVFGRTTKKAMPMRASCWRACVGGDRGAGWIASDGFVAMCSIGIVYAVSWRGACSWVSVEEWHT